MLTIILATFVVAPLVAFVAFLWSQGVLRLKSKREKYPPYLLSEKNNGEIAGWIETITGLTGPRAPHFVYEGMKKLPKGHPWIIQGNFPNRSASGYAYAVADIHLAKQILMSPQSTKSVMYKDVDNLTCGFQNIFTSNGHRWKHARKQVAPAFSSNHIKRMVRICEEQLSILLKERIDVWAKEGKAFDLGKEMVCLTLSIISEAAFEYPMSREEMKLFTDNLETAAECFVIMNPLHQAFPWLFPQVWKANKAAKTLQELAYKIMRNYEKKHGKVTPVDPKSSKYENNFENDTIISRIMHNPYYNGDEERAADIVIFMAAGHDTTAYSVAWTLLEITKNKPPELAEYRKKIANLPREEWRRVDELHYMIKEGMRLQPVLAMGTVRDVAKEIVYQQNDEKIVLPKDSIYFINLFPMFRNPEYYDEPDEFRPSRWVNPKTEAAHVPFSIGARNCIGQTLANAELHTVMSVLCAQYDFSVVDEGHPEYLTTLKPAGVKMIPKKLF